MFLYAPSVKGDTFSDRHVRVWAMLLQLIGAGTVWYDLTHTATEFGDGPSLRKVWEYIKSVFVTPPPINGSASITLQGANMTSHGRITSGFIPSQPIDARVAHLERFALKLDEELGNVQQSIRQQKSELTSDIVRLRNQTHRDVEAVKGQLRNALIGNFSILTFGVIWLGIGIVLASIPTEVTEFSVFLGWFGHIR